MDGKTLLESTYEQLKARDRALTLRRIAEGAGVDYEWLAKFSQNRINDPGVQKVEAVHKFLLGQSSNAA